MSTADTHELDVEQQYKGPPASMAERAEQRRRHLLSQNTETFDVPGYIGILRVEYRAMDYKELRKIAARHQRVKDDADQELYIAADTLIAASENSFEVLPGEKEGEERVRELGLTWGLSLARELGVTTPGDTARQAVFAVFPQKTWLTQHYTDYTDWLRGIGVQVDEEQSAEFRSDPT